jgi:hypothetical protein
METIIVKTDKKNMKILFEKHAKGEIINPAITCKAVCNYRMFKTDEEKIKLQNIVANYYLLGLSHDDIASNADAVWDIIDGKDW